MEKVEDQTPAASHWARWLPWALGATAVALTVIGLAVGISSHPSGSVVTAAGLSAVALAYGVGGAVLAARRPGNAIGWLLLAIGLSEAILVASMGWAALALQHPSLPWGEIGAWMGSWAYIPALGSILTFLLLWYPTGHPPTPRWRWVEKVAVIGLCLAIGGSAVSLWPLRFAMLAEPNKDFSPEGAAGSIGGIGMLLLFGVAGIASIISVVVRWRRSRGDERQQLRWFLAAAVIATVGFAISGIDTRYLMLVTGMLLLPVSMVIAVLKYHLYDLDIVIRKTVVFFLIAAALTVLSLAVLLLVPTFAVGTLTGWERGLFVVGVIIGTTFGPLRRGARRIADRLVYGTRATPYEVLSAFASRVGTTYADDDVTGRMATLLREATGAISSTVWLDENGSLRPVASSPDTPDTAPWPMDGVEVHYRGERLGGLSVEMPANDPLEATRLRLIRDLAGQAGPVLANVRLVEELRASRRRIVAAQDERAKKLERNIHDGAQQQLVALAVKQRLAGALVGKDDERLRAMLEELSSDTNDALENLRDLARGVYPPLLADKGLGAALEAQARKAATPTTVHADGIDRLSAETESAVYFSCLEALQNVAKYAHASRAEIALTNGDGSVRFTVTDDGEGFDASATSYGTGLQGIADRLAALGGTLTVTSTPGQGTTIDGRVPA